MANTTLEILESRINKMAYDNLKMPENWAEKAFLSLRAEVILEYLQVTVANKDNTIQSIINNDWYGIRNLLEPYRLDLLRREKEKIVEQLLGSLQSEDPGELF